MPRQEDDDSSDRDRFRAALDVIAAGVVLCDADGNIEVANQRAQELLGVPGASLIGRQASDPRWQLLDQRGQPLAPEHHPVRRTIETGEAVYGARIGCARPDREEPLWLGVSVVPDRAPSGELR